ncbi:MAG: RraA family protein [Mogibacterium sp.]|nr:RraA family protein [Mogibacterium sp.]MBQ6501468.1 RraA family protein [Mogibacterium sp.]
MKPELTLPKEIIEAFSKLDTPSISDAMDKLRITGGCLGIHPVVPDTYICGQAFTIHYAPCGEEVKGTVGDFIDDILPGEVAVIDNNGRLDCTVWGDIMSYYATKHGIAGTVIDGVCRDINVIRKLKYPIFSKSIYMVTGKDRVYVDHINEPVSISGVQVCPGDLICADNTGVVVVPFKRAEEVLKVALEIEAVEQQIMAKIEAGVTLKEARQQTGYHKLQTPED